MTLTNGTRRFIYWIGIFILIMLILDSGTRFLLKSLYSSPTYGSKEEYLLRAANEDIIILGNSVGELHIDAKAIEDSLGLSCYNGAICSTTMKSHLAMLRFLLSHHKPRAIIYAITEKNLIWMYKDVFIDRLKRFYGNDHHITDSLVPTFYPHQRWMLHSSLRRLDRYVISDILHKNGIRRDRDLTPQGTRLIPPQNRSVNSINNKDDSHIHPARLNQLMTFIRLCREAGVTLIVTIPPNLIISKGETLCRHDLDSLQRSQGDFILWHDAQVPGINEHHDYFLDPKHMDMRGARIYTDTVVARLKSVLSIENH